MTFAVLALVLALLQYLQAKWPEMVDVVVVTLAHAAAAMGWSARIRRTFLRFLTTLRGVDCWTVFSAMNLSRTCLGTRMVLYLSRFVRRLFSAGNASTPAMPANRAMTLLGLSLRIAPTSVGVRSSRVSVTDKQPSHSARAWS